MDPTLNSVHRLCCIRIRTCLVVALVFDIALTVTQMYTLAAATEHLAEWLWAHVIANIIAMLLCILALWKIQPRLMMISFIINVLDAIFALINFIVGCLYLTVLSSQAIARCRVNVALDECNKRVFLFSAVLFTFGITILITRLFFSYKCYRGYKFLEDMQAWRATTLPPTEVAIIAPRSPDSIHSRSPMPPSDLSIQTFGRRNRAAATPAVASPNAVQADSASSASDMATTIAGIVQPKKKKSFRLMTKSTPKQIKLEPLERFPTSALKQPK